LDATDISRIRWLSAPALRPDGHAVAAIEGRLGLSTGRLETDLILVDLRTDATELVGAHDVAAWGGCWDHRGERLVFARDVDGDRQPMIVRPGQGGARPLAHARAPEACQLARASWSSDDELLAFPANGAANARSWLRVVHVATGDVTDVDIPDADVVSCAWARTDRRLAVVARDRSTSGSSLWITALDGDAPWRLVDGFARIGTPVWESGDDRICFIAGSDGTDQAANMKLVTIRTQHPCEVQVADLDVSIGQRVQSDDPRGYDEPRLRWPADGRGVLTTCSAGGGTDLVRVPVGPDVAHPGAAMLHPIVSGEQVVLDFDCTDDGRSVVYVSSDPSGPGELFLVGSTGHRRLTARNADWQREVELATVSLHHSQAPSGPRIDTWVYTPPDLASSEPGPAVVAIHGGPHWPAGWRFSFEYQRHAALRRTVVIANPRGSQGYGEQFARANQGDWGGCDADDICGVAQLAGELPGVDPGRIAVTGVSYGGYLACLIAIRMPQLRAVIAENPLTDLARYVDTNGDPAFASIEFGGLPSQIPAFYADRSPVTHAARLVSPLLLIHGELDDDCLIEQSERMLVALRDHGRRAHLLRIPDEGHAMVLEGTLDHRLLRWQEIDRFLDAHLRRPAAVEPRN